MRLGPALVGIGTTILILAPASIAAAAPEDLGALVITPAVGDLDTPIDLLTDGECSRGTTFVVTMDGRGLAESRGNLVGATKLDSLGIPRFPGHYEVPVPVTLREYLLRSLDRTRLSGEYTLTFVCRNTLDTEPLQVFTGDLTVAQDGGYTALGDSAREVRDVVGAEVYDRVAEAERLSREAEANEPMPGPEADSAAASPVTDSTDSDAGVMSWLRPVLIVAGILLLGAVGLSLAMSWSRSRGLEEGRRAAKAEADSAVDADQERADSSA